MQFCSGSFKNWLLLTVILSCFMDLLSSLRVIASCKLSTNCFMPTHCPWASMPCCTGSLMSATSGAPGCDLQREHSAGGAGSRYLRHYTNILQRMGGHGIGLIKMVQGSLCLDAAKSRWQRSMNNGHLLKSVWFCT